MKNSAFYAFFHKQILVMALISFFPSMGYIALGWYYGFLPETLYWYAAMVASSLWGVRLHRMFSFESMDREELQHWYRELTYFFYLCFALWTAIFILCTLRDIIELHYIAIFTQIGASVVASTLLVSDKKLFIPTIAILMFPLITYFVFIGEWYGYILTFFSSIFTIVLLYGSFSSHRLLEKTTYQASHDMLTTLYNRHYFLIALQQSINALKRQNSHSFLLLIDLDHFKTINDTLGHDVGDELLQEVAQRIRKVMPTNEFIIARLGGDEFVIIGEQYSDREMCQFNANLCAEELLQVLKESYEIDGHHLYISASIGVSLISGKNENAHRFMKEADIAMYEVKAKGRDGVILFNEAMSKRVEYHLEIERQLHFALENGEFTLEYQPQVDREQSVIGAEVLVRWHNAELGMVSPATFIPIAEQTGVIVELGRFILEESFKTLREWDSSGIRLEQFSINISMRQFFHHTFVDDIAMLAKKYLDSRLCSKLVFEMTETIVAEDMDKVVLIMLQIKQLGIRFSLDDFGTGYSSLSYLKQMPVDELKIDRSFVSELEHNEDDRSMVVTILKMAKVFGLSVVAEGVETFEQSEFLVQNACDILQGYHFAKPMKKADFEHYYRR